MHTFQKFTRDAALLFGRTAREAARNAGLAFVAPILLSLFLLVLFQGVYGGIADAAGWPTDAFIDWIAAGGVFVSVFVGAGYTAGGLLRDLDSGYLQRLRLLPVHPGAVLVGKVSFEAARAALVAAAVLALAFALGADNHAGVPGFLFVVALAAAFSFAWNGIFYLTALAARTHAAVLGLQPIFMPVIMFSTFWVPLGFMPGWYQAVATWNPFNPVLVAGRSVLLGAPVWPEVGIAVAVMAGLAALTYTLAARRYARLATAD
jgi:ABC-2 type transport system permease protein